MSDHPRRHVRVTELARAIGPAAAQTLVGAWGGTEGNYVPRALKAGHRLEQLLGRVAAEALSENYGGQYLAIPRGASRPVKTAIWDAVGSTREIAQAFGTTQRHVRRVRKARREAAGQPDLLSRD